MFASPHTLTALILAFFCWMLYIGWRTHTGHNKAELRENFLIGNRGVSALLVAVGTIMGWVDAFQFGFLPSMSFDMGWGVLWYLSGVTLAFLVLALFAGQIRERAAKTGAYMMGNYFSRLVSPRAAAGIGIMMTSYFFIWMAVQFVVGGKVLGDLTGLPYGVIIGAMGVVTLVYMMLGGFLASVRTDFIQFCIFMLFVIAIMALWAPAAPAWAPNVVALSETGLWSGISLLVINICSAFAAPDVWQRVYSANSARDARRSMFGLAIGMSAVLWFFAALGFTIKGMGFVATSADVPTAIFTHLVPAWLMPLAVLAFIAALMSTIATTLFGTAMTISSDILLEMGFITREKLPTTCRGLMVLSLLAGLTLASLNIDIVTLALTDLSVTMVVVPYIACALMGWKMSEAAMFYSLILSIIVFFIGAWFNIYTGSLALLPLVVATGTLLLFEGLTRKR